MTQERIRIAGVGGGDYNQWRILTNKSVRAVLLGLFIDFAQHGVRELCHFRSIEAGFGRFAVAPIRVPIA